jgi:hypothetical protein
MPYEFLPRPHKGEIVKVFDREGKYLCDGKVIRILDGKFQDKTAAVSIEIPKRYYLQARNFKVEE